jgi:hypothetical protein
MEKEINETKKVIQDVKEEFNRDMKTLKTKPNQTNQPNKQKTRIKGKPLK